MGLYCLGALRGLCGFCVRERLGGFGACGVFAFRFRFFSVFALLLSFGLSLCLPFVLSAPVVVSFRPCGSLGVVGVAFSLSDVQTKRKGAKCVTCVLSCPAPFRFICLGHLLAWLPLPLKISTQPRR